ncbi:hypothetical protein [Gulbenkiania mobilis]|uniref:DUF3298 domain-containing protein n=1 Tax=Gulbenkiania mobilis TaxID=397457 RepID=A0ABY2CXB4_GULMO|nr:hypothetical protein EV669_104319 [Gulbenkiania mobilis]
MNRHTRWGFWMLVWLWAACAQAVGQTYQGRIGTQPVVMELAIGKDGQVQGRYFYRKYHADIALSGQRTQDGRLQLGENLPYDRSRTDFTLQAQGQGWQGQWKGPKARTALPVVLVPLEVSALRPFDPLVGAWKQQDPYTYARLSGLVLRPGGRQSFAGHSLRWMEEPVSGVRMFRVETGLSEDVQARLNRLLAERQWQEVQAAFDCRGGAARYGGGEFEQTVTPGFLNARLLSVSIFTSYDCGGAHPDFGDRPLNLDLASGRELQLEDLLWLGKGTPRLPRKPDGSRPEYRYETETLAPWLVRTMQRLHPHQMKAEPEGCDYTDPGVWQFVSWYFTPKGLYVGPSFARVARACEYPDWSWLPWSVVKQHPGSLATALP